MESAYKNLEESRLAANRIAKLFNKEPQLTEVILKEFVGNEMLGKALENNLTKSEYIKRNLARQELPELLKTFNESDKIPFEKVFEIERRTKLEPEKILKLENTRNELIFIVQEYNRLRSLKKGLSGIKHEKDLCKIMENFFGLEQAYHILAQAGTVNYKKGEYPWMDEIEIGAQDINELIKNIIELKTADFEKVLKGKTLDEYVKNYYEDYITAMGKIMTDEMIKAMQTNSIKLFDGQNSTDALIVAGGFLVYIEPELPEERVRPINLSVFAEIPDENEMIQIYEIFKEYFWPRLEMETKTFEEFKSENNNSFHKIVCVIKDDETGKFQGFFICVLLDYKTLEIRTFHVLKDLRNPMFVYKAFMSMSAQIANILEKSNIETITFSTWDKMVLKLGERLGFEIKETIGENSSTRKIMQVAAERVKIAYSKMIN